MRAGQGRSRLWGVVVVLLGLGAGVALAAGAPDRWWRPGEERVLPASLDYADPDGVLRLLLAGGPMPTKGHPFFTALGPNGRACVTCHQPADGMSLSAATARRRWDETGGKDPLFAAIDEADFRPQRGLRLQPVGSRTTSMAKSGSTGGPAPFRGGQGRAMRNKP